MIVSTITAILGLAYGFQVEKPIERIDCPQVVTLPMLSSPRQSPLIEIEIGGKKYHFALDTGATGGRMSQEIVDQMGLKPIGVVQAGDPSGKNTREVSIYRIPQIKVGGATLFGVVMHAENGIEPKGSHASFDGVIGYALFKDVLLTLDYPHKQVILNPQGMSSDQLKRSMPYKTEHGIPLLEIRVGSVKVNGHVDSGSDGGLSIPMKYKDQIHMDGEPRKVGRARTLFNTFDIFLAKVKDPISLGGQKMPIDQVEMHDLFPFGNIGGRLLHKFTVSIDQKKKRILFESPS